MTFSNSLDPDQARQNVGPDLHPSCLTFLMEFVKDFFEKGDFKKKSADNKKLRCEILCLVNKDGTLYSKRGPQLP